MKSKSLWLSLVVMSLVGGAQAANSTYIGHHYTVTYDDAGSFGAMSLLGGTSFGWAGAPLVTLHAGAGQTITQSYGPAFTISADSGYRIDSLSFLTTVSGSAGSGVQINGMTGSAGFTFDGGGSSSFSLSNIGPSFYSRTFAGNYLQLTSQDGGSTSVQQARFNVAVTPVPEPETVAMLLAGLGLMGLMRRRQEKR